MGYPMESMKVFTLNYHRTNDFLSPSWGGEQKLVGDLTTGLKLCCQNRL